MVMSLLIARMADVAPLQPVRLFSYTSIGPYHTILARVSRDADVGAVHTITVIAVQLEVCQFVAVGPLDRFDLFECSELYAAKRPCGPISNRLVELMRAKVYLL